MKALDLRLKQDFGPIDRGADRRACRSLQMRNQGGLPHAPWIFGLLAESARKGGFASCVGSTRQCWTGDGCHVLGLKIIGNARYA